MPISSTTTTTNSESGTRRKRSWSRAVFSALQRKGLEKRFSLQKYITKPDRRQLAATLGLTDAQVSFLLGKKLEIIKLLIFHMKICFSG